MSLISSGMVSDDISLVASYKSHCGIVSLLFFYVICSLSPILLPPGPLGRPRRSRDYHKVLVFVLDI